MTAKRPDAAELVRIMNAPGHASARAASFRDFPSGVSHTASTSALHPDPAVCGDFHMRIARDGTWFYHGSPITRKPLVRLFSTVLRRDDKGDYWLVTPVEQGRIEVEDSPFTAVALTVQGEGRNQRLTFRTNLDDEVTAGSAHPLDVIDRPAEAAGVREPVPYILVRDRLEARIVRPVFYQLVDLAVPGEVDGHTSLGVWSDGIFFPLGGTS